VTASLNGNPTSCSGGGTATCDITVAPGSYTARVQDSNGGSSDSRTVTVSGP
jgi:hypothetical protein